MTQAPLNLHLSAACPAAGAPRLTERVEQKFFIPPHRKTLALALLQRTCRPDPNHPLDQVNSLYFDTLDLDQLQRSDGGDFAKDKVRIRWYGPEHDPHRTGNRNAPNSGKPLARAASAPSCGTPGDEVAIWLELKSRRGFTSNKQRTKLGAQVEALAYSALAGGIVPTRTLTEVVAGFGFFPRGHLRPIIAISYLRYRFIEPRTGFRISIDSHIRSSLVAPGLGTGERGLELPGAVVEVKGPLFRVPPVLRPLAEIGSSWTRYSKYSSSLDGHAATRGGVSRLWPSGMIEREPGALAPVRVPTESSLLPWSPRPVRLVQDYETE